MDGQHASREDRVQDPRSSRQEGRKAPAIRHAGPTGSRHVVFGSVHLDGQDGWSKLLFLNHHDGVIMESNLHD
jgi:hypothetical protein